MAHQLTESDFDRLERYLTAPERIDSTLPVDSAQGLFAAVACAPAPIPEERWMQAILGAAPRFDTPEESEEIAGLLQRFQEETARQLNEGEGFDFILYGPEGAEDLATWCDGFLAGVDLSDPPWADAADADDLHDILFPFLALTGQARAMALEEGEEWMSEEEEVEMLVEIREGLADHLLDVRRFWFEKGIPPTVKRETPKIGRNDPCPCGSGRKYKACCGR
jgi:uncharacterized protein